LDIFVCPSRQNRTYSQEMWASIWKGNTAHPSSQAASLWDSPALWGQVSCWAKSGSHGSAFDSWGPDLSLHGLRKLLSCWCLGNLWRQLLNFRKTWKFWHSEDRDEKANVNYTKPSLPAAALRVTWPWLERSAGKHHVLPGLGLPTPGGILTTPSEGAQMRCMCGFIWLCTYLNWDLSSRCCAEIIPHWKWVLKS